VVLQLEHSPDVCPLRVSVGDILASQTGQATDARADTPAHALAITSSRDPRRGRWSPGRTSRS
jgi:hypothetical protein